MLYQELDASFKKIIRITLPILLVTLTSSCMIVTDRLILAKTSVIAMNAVGISSNFVLIFTYFITCVASFNEIFVGQLNGDKQYQKLAGPTWQMIYFSLAASLILFVPLAYFSRTLNCLPAAFYADGVTYQQILFYFAFLPTLSASIAGFFVGQGKTTIVSIAVVFACFVNLILDVWFVYLLRWGVRGAAIATVIAHAVEVLLLSTVFFNAKNRQYFGTCTNCSLQFDLMWKIIKIAFPTALGISLLLLSRWSIQIIVGKLPVVQSTLYNLGLSVYLFLVFIADALNRAIAAITANLISQKNLQGIKITFHRFLIMITTFFGLIGLISWYFFNPILNWATSLHVDLIPFKNEITTIFILVFVSTFLESCFNVIWGILSAGGDTKFPVLTNLTSLISTVILPALILLKTGYLSSSVTIYQFFGLWAIICTLLFYLRYRSLKWYRSII